MTRIGITLAAIGSVLLTASGPARAQGSPACSPPTSLVYHGVTTFGALPLPTNVKILVVYGGDWPALGEATMRDVKLRLLGGAEVAITPVFSIAKQTGGFAATVEIVPDALLLPDTDYEVLTRIQGTPCGGAGEPTCVGDPKVQYQFTTGASPDLTKPVLTGQVKAKVPEAAVACEQADCCGDSRVMLLELEWPAATDDSAVMYNVYVDGELIVDNWTGTKLSGYKVCEGVAPPIGRNLRGGRFEVRATDPSGNVSDDALTVTFDPACPGTLDAGPGPSEQDGSGCSVAGGASRLPAIAALLVAVAIRRRRRW